MERAVAHTRLVAAPEKADSTERGIRAFEPHAARRYEEASTLASLAASSDPANFNAVFIAGYAALHLKRWDEATSAFDTMIRQRNKIGMSPAIAICHIMAARAHAGAGRVEDARKRYQEAFTLWKDADADLPLLVQARQEFARLGT